METQKIVARLSEALKRLKAELSNMGTPPTAFVSAHTLQDAKRQGMALLSDTLDEHSSQLSIKSVETVSLITQLEPANMDIESRETCLPETRVDVLQDIFASLIDVSPRHRATWLRGLAGSGKSTILNTIAQYSSNLRRCGAFLFWDRNDPVNSDPRRVIRTLAHQLAQSNPAFADELASRIVSSPQIMKSSLDEQFRSLLQEPLATLAATHDPGPILIIFDALDECGTPDTRKRLLGVLSSCLAKLPKTFRLLVASRDEPDIRAAFSRQDIAICDIRIDDKSTISDISQFFRQRLSSDAPAFAACDLPSDWPRDAVRQRLVTLSGGLFIWASTTIRFIESGPPEQRLKKVLDSSARGQSHDRLDDLYRVALTHPFDSYDADELEAVYSILGAIVVAREQLTDQQLSRLLDVELSMVREVLSRLQPLLQGGHGKAVQVLHSSFTDFLCSPERCRDVQWCIRPPTHHCNLVAGCFRIMQRDLRFNICNIETSYCQHLEVHGIQNRIDTAITPVLMYASQYWADHLELGSPAESSSQQFADKVMDFMTERSLHWVEVFSLKNQMSMIPVILQKATSWAKVGSLFGLATRS